MKSFKKIISAVLLSAMLLSLFSISAFALNAYSGYNAATGEITLEDGVTDIKLNDTFKVYVSVNLDTLSKEKVTAFHILGTLSDSLEIVNSGFAAEESLTAIPSGSAVEGVSYEKMIHNSKTTGQTIDFTAVVMKNADDNAISKNENGVAKLIWLELKAIDSGYLNVNIADSYLRTSFEDDAADKFCLSASFSGLTTVGGDDGGSKRPSGYVHNAGKDGSIDKVTVSKISGAVADIDSENKKITITVPEGTDLSELVLNISYTGTAISYKKGDKIDLSEPQEITVTGTNGKKIAYTVEAVYETVEPTPGVDDGSEYSDVEKTRWSYEMIDAMVKSGLVSGYGYDENGKLIVKPTALITREEAAKISVTAYGLETVDGATTDFADNDKISDWALPYVAAGASHPNRMVRGYDDNTFRAKNNVTREELVTMIVNTFGFGEDTNPELSYADKDEITWSAGYVSKAVSLGVILGYEDGTFKPSQYVTREEAFTMFDRALKLYTSLME